MSCSSWSVPSRPGSVRSIIHVTTSAASTGNRRFAVLRWSERWCLHSGRCLKDETIVKLVYTQTPDTSTTRYKLFLHTEDVWKMSRKFPVNLSVTCSHLQVCLQSPAPTALRLGGHFHSRIPRVSPVGGPEEARPDLRDAFRAWRGKDLEESASRHEMESRCPLWFMGCPLDAWTSTGEDRPSKNSFFFPQRAAESCR